jgi:hypothetical protein
MRAISQIPVNFLYQSYLDTTLQETAILVQNTNQPIIPTPDVIPVVASTKYRVLKYEGAGRAVGLHSSSDTPLAVKFYGSDNDSGVLLLKPGQVIQPGPFTSMEYGLPFGWLGGGRGLLLIAHTPEAKLDVGSALPEFIFHRTRLLIQASASPLPALKRNWPLQFPWSQAVRGTNSADQKGNPLIRVVPTRTLLRLRLQIAAPVAVGLVFRGSREFDESDLGVVAVADLNSTFCEVTFPASTDPLFAPFPTISIPEDFLRLCLDEGGLSAFDLGNAAVLAEAEIDVVRFGRI